MTMPWLQRVLLHTKELVPTVVLLDKVTNDLFVLAWSIRHLSTVNQCECPVVLASLDVRQCPRKCNPAREPSEAQAQPARN